MEKIALAARIPSTKIIEEKHGVLRVVSNESQKANGYLVRFEDDGMPSCNCHDWKEHFLPCKHIFAIILQSKEYSWESLPEAYRNSPYFTLDEQFSLKPDVNNDEIPHEKIELQEIQILTESTKDEEQPVDDINAVELELPTAFAKRSDGAACRDTLDQLRGLTFNIADKETLLDMNKQLTQLLQETRSKLDKEDRLMTEVDSKKTTGQKRRIKERALQTESKKTRHNEYMPLPKEFKRCKDERVGVSADKERLRKSTSLDIKTGLFSSKYTLQGYSALPPDSNRPEELLNEQPLSCEIEFNIRLNNGKTSCDPN